MLNGYFILVKTGQAKRYDSFTLSQELGSLNFYIPTCITFRPLADLHRSEHLTLCPAVAFEQQGGKWCDGGMYSSEMTHRCVVRE